MSAPQFRGNTIEDAKRYIERYRALGVDCPCCDQHIQDYDRTLCKQLAEALIIMAREAPDGRWVHLPSLLKHNGAAATGNGMSAMLRYWGFIEQCPDKDLARRIAREQAGERKGKGTGVWRILEHGVDFAQGLTRVPKSCRIRTGKYGTEEEVASFSQETVNIDEAMAIQFDYTEVQPGRRRRRSPFRTNGATHEPGHHRPPST